MHLRWGLYWIAAALFVGLALFAGPAFGGSAPPVTFSGNLSQDDDVDFFTFTLTETSDVFFESHSHRGGTTFSGANVSAGGFDSIMSLFDAQGDFITDGDCNEGDCGDFSEQITLDAGTYTVAISQFDNFANDPNLSNGFFRDGDGNFTIKEFCLSPATGPFCDEEGAQRTSAYSFDVTLDGSGGGGPTIEIELIGFEDLSGQTDNIGLFDPKSQQTVFRVFDDTQEVVATATGELASFAGIVEDFLNRYFTLGSAAGTPTSTRGSLVLADFPGIGATSGAFVDFFQTPRDLRDAQVSALIRNSGAPAFVSSAVGSTNMVRGVLRDDKGNESATAMQPLTSEFQNMQFEASEFDGPVGGALGVDLSRIAGLRFEFFSSSKSAPASSFDIDDVQVAPEPLLGLVQGVAVLTLALVARLRAATKVI